MEIEQGKIYENRTKNYLFRSLYTHGIKYRRNLSLLFKLAIGINDILDNSEGTNIYVLVDAGQNVKLFVKILEWLRKQPYYIKDYIFDDILTGYQHMLVLHVPDRNIYDHFMSSNYSIMYSDSLAHELFTEDESLGVLTRSDETTKIFVNALNKYWGEKFTYDEWVGEVDYPWIPEEEKFNYKSIIDVNKRRTIKVREPEVPRTTILKAPPGQKPYGYTNEERDFGTRQ